MALKGNDANVFLYHLNDTDNAIYKIALAPEVSSPDKITDEDLNSASKICEQLSLLSATSAPTLVPKLQALSALKYFLRGCILPETTKYQPFSNKDFADFVDAIFCEGCM